MPGKKKVDVNSIPQYDLEVIRYNENGEVEKVETHHKAYAVSSPEELEALFETVLLEEEDHSCIFPELS